jgi:XTP/dITP diphosphohydrolase
LNGEPGVYSARYAGSLSEFESENIRNEANIQKLLYNLSGKTNRRARFRTVIGFITDNHEYTFEGIVNGQIVSQKRGKSGFGYDPVFVPDGFDITFAEMTLKEKNKISHRARAFRKFAEFLKNSKK